MSWARTPVSTSISSRLRRPRATTRTATPVTNIASVASMNGAPRIASTPIPWDSDEPDPERIAMIGIIVSGSAVPTAARTEPTRIRTSMSALERRGGEDAQDDDEQDEDRNERHPPLASAAVADQ